MRGKACSAEFMRRIEKMVAAAGERSRKELIQAISHQTCLKQRQVYNLLGALELEKKVLQVTANDERPQPTILVEAMTAPDPVALAVEAVEGGWTAEQVRQEAARRRVAEDSGAASPPVPAGRYRTIVVDPPWSYGNKSGRQRPDYSERMMALDEVAAFDIQRWVTEDACHLYLWVTDAYAGDVYTIVRAWGFDPKTWLVWVKDRIGMGNYYRHQHEFCVFAVKGRLRLKRMDAPTVFNAPVRGHSEKPDAFYSLVESCSPGPYLDVFGRRLRAGWDVFGDEVNCAEAYQWSLDGPKESRVVSGRAEGAE